MQLIERRKIIDAAAIVTAVLAAAEKDSGIRARGGLAHLDIKPVGVQGDFAGNGDYVECR